MQWSNSSLFSGRSRHGHRFLVAAVALAMFASTAVAHDFWIIPDMFMSGPDGIVHISGRQGGGKFPDGTGVPVDRVIDARIIGATTSTKITDLTVAGNSLKLHSKPSAPGQYLVAVSLSTRDFRETPAGVLRWLRAEGGAPEAARLERENTLSGIDTVVFTAASYAATVAQVGANGPKAFGKTAGLRLEFVPLNDPLHVHVGDTLHLKVLGNGKPQPGIGVDLATGVDSAGSASASVVRVSFTADANGVVHLPLQKAGPMMLRSAYASHKANGAHNDWDVSRTTYVFSVAARH